MSDSQIHPLFVCPSCRGALKRVGDSSECLDCGAIWRLRNGIPIFTSHEFSWTPVAPEIMDRLVDDAVSTGNWREAVARQGEAIPAYSRGYITREDRADWAFLLPLRPDWRVLDIGSGWGSVSIPLSRWVGEIFCGDPTFVNARFLDIRSKQSGIMNLHAFGCNALDDPRFPFSPESFNLIVLNGVLEWVGNVDLSVPVRDLQVRALEAVRNLIKPGGYLYIGIENRYAYGAFLGSRPHGELPYIGLMPRRIARWAMSMIKGVPHRTYIYGLKGYRRLLSDSGFRNVSFYLPRPSYRDPFWLIPADSRQGVRIWARHLAKAETFTNRIVHAWAKWLPIRSIWPDYSIICKKDEQ